MNSERRHGKALTSFEESMMDLLIKVEESEQYLQRHQKKNRMLIMVEDVEEERYPSFLIREKKEEEEVVSEDVEERMIPINIGKEMRVNAPASAENKYEVKLTTWEWLEVRWKGITTLLLLAGTLFLQIYTNWTDMDGVSAWILKGMKYCCIILLILKLAHWIKSGEMHQYLNEEV